MRKNIPMDDANIKRLVELCSCPEADCLRELDTAATGLSSEEAEWRLKEYGFNILAKVQPHPLLMDFLHRIKDPLVIQLLVICVVAAWVGDLRSAVVVGGMIVLSVLL
ncbi:MAG TPA: cation-transporting P-type ATPase, partial [bacterium]